MACLYAGQYLIADAPDRGAHHGTDDHTGSKDAAGAAGADGEPGRENLGEWQQQDHPQWQREQPWSHTDLHPAVAHPQCLRQRQPDQAHQQPADAGLQPVGQRKAVKAVGDPVEAACVQPAEQPA